jgi:hypothetical protein
LKLITALQNSGLRSTENYVNGKLRCRCDAAARRLARQARGNDVHNLHSLQTPEASQRTKLLRRFQLANVQALDEDDVKDVQTVREGGIAGSRRDGSAVSPNDAIEEIDLLMANIEALLSCPHANPKFSSETQMPGTEISALALERPIAIAHGAICCA